MGASDLIKAAAKYLARRGPSTYDECQLKHLIAAGYSHGFHDGPTSHRGGSLRSGNFRPRTRPDADERKRRQPAEPAGIGPVVDRGRPAICRPAGLRAASLSERSWLCRVPVPDRPLLSRLWLRLSGLFLPAGLPLLLCTLSLLL